jgi:tripartite-type tricarboxylate transporter receptor subunit TctC
MLARRRFLHLAAAATGALPHLSGVAATETYPSRPVRLIVGYSAGSNLDILARLLGQWLSERLGQQFVVENRPGAGSNIATETVVRAPPDGYTLLMVSAGNAINATLYDNLGFNFIRDIAPVAGIMRSTNVMVVSPGFPARTIPEFIAYAKAHPGKVNMASGGSGSGPHVAGELFKAMTGTDMRHVPYRGSPQALTDLVGGQVQVMFDLMSSSIQLVHAGKLRALGVTTASRSPALPEVPSVSEFVPGYEASGWQGIGAPGQTPPEIISRLNAEIRAALAEQKIKARLAELGGTALGGTPGEFGALIADETSRWAKVISDANIRPD